MYTYYLAQYFISLVLEFSVNLLLGLKSFSHPLTIFKNLACRFHLVRKSVMEVMLKSYNMKRDPLI